MEYKTETVMPREAMPEVNELFNVTGKIPPKELYGFFRFIRGVNYGLDMADQRAQPAVQQPISQAGARERR